MKLNINQKIWFGFGILLALVGVGSVLGYLKSQQAEKASARLVHVHLAELKASAAARAEFSRARTAEQTFLSQRDPGMVPVVKAAMAKVREHVAESRTSSMDATRKGAAEKAGATATAYLDSFLRLHELWIRRGLTPDTGFEGELRKAVHSVEAKVRELRLADLNVIMLMARRHEKDYLLRGDPRYLVEINTRIREFTEQMPKLSMSTELQHEISALWSRYATTMKAVVEGDEEIKKHQQEFTRLADSLTGQITTIAEAASRDIDLAQRDTLGTLSSGRQTTLTVGVISGTVGIVMAVWIAFSLGTLNRGIRRAVELIGNGSREILNASTQLSRTSQTLANGSNEQAASLEETSAALEEITSMTRRNAESAQQAKELSNQTRSAADTGAADMSEMKRAMDAIKTSSHDISKIIKTIDEIAFQTNILALNAAVEAARAGEAGMGFAVVADEVRNLAQRSAQSAKETAAKIEEAMKNSEHGVRISNQVAKSLDEIAGKARQVDTFVAEIARASQEQSQGVAQVNTTVSQMDKITQSNASNAEETAAAAEELNAQSATLLEAVADLRRLVENGNEAATPTPVPASPAKASPARRSANGTHGPLHHASIGHAAPPAATRAETDLNFADCDPNGTSESRRHSR